jgi:hypothetical protein
MRGKVMPARQYGQAMLVGEDLDLEFRLPG